MLDPCYTHTGPIQDLCWTHAGPTWDSYWTHMGVMLDLCGVGSVLVMLSHAGLKAELQMPSAELRTSLARAA